MPFFMAVFCYSVGAEAGAGCRVPGLSREPECYGTHDSAVLYRTFVAERRLNLARPLQGRENRHHTIIFVASATIEMRRCSAVANATEYSLGLGYRGLKATAKLMSTLRVGENLTRRPATSGCDRVPTLNLDDTPNREPMKPRVNADTRSLLLAVLYRTFVAERRLNLARPLQGWEFSARHQSPSRQRRVNHPSIVADATKITVAGPDPALKHRAKFITTLRVANDTASEFLCKASSICL